MKCQREAANTTVDFLGLWNEPHWRSDYWGGANYTKALRRQLNAAGFAATKLVLLDDAPQYSGPGGLPRRPILRYLNADVRRWLPERSRTRRRDRQRPPALLTSSRAGRRPR